MKARNGYVIYIVVGQNTLFYHAGSKSCYKSLAAATIYGDNQSALTDIRDKDMFCSTGQVMTYNEAKKNYGKD